MHINELNAHKIYKKTYCFFMDKYTLKNDIYFFFI